MEWALISIALVGLIGGILYIKHFRVRMLESFKVLSMDVMRTNTDSFLQLAKSQFDNLQALAKQDLDQKQKNIEEALSPVKASLEKFDSKIGDLEKSRVRSDEMIQQQVRSLIDAQKDLRGETQALVNALRAPQARGRWGEIQLKRVVEMAGMLEYCDFTTQTTTQTDEGRLRPDLIVKLPGGKNIVVDAKTPLMAFLDAMAATDAEQKVLKLAEHARYVRRHIEQLGRKSYWDQFSPTPEFVLLFLPGEHFFAAALEQDPSLIEAGVAQNVIIATPTTLIALLRSVAYGWRQEKLAQSARVMGEMGRELHKRLFDFCSHLQRVGKSLESSVDSYNKAVGSLENRVLVTARRFSESGATRTSENIESLAPIDQKPRALEAPEAQSHAHPQEIR